MIRINLLPFRAARKKENVRRQLSIFVLLLIVVTLGLVYYNTILNARIEDLNGKISSTRTALQAKKKQAAEVDRIQKDLAVLKKKTEIIVDLALNRKDAVLLMDAMTRMVVEKQMWFTSMESKQGTLDVRGIALDNKTVADFMTRLETSPYFSDVRLQSTRRQKIGDLDNLKSFVVTTKRIPLSEIAKKEETEEGAEKS
jgi:type IV pilus assembly protein PilN